MGSRAKCVFPRSLFLVRQRYAPVVFGPLPREYGRLRERPMPAYLVRTIDEHDIVGFFAADEMDDLLVAVDECTDPADCEYV